MAAFRGGTVHLAANQPRNMLPTDVILQNGILFYKIIVIYGLVFQKRQLLPTKELLPIKRFGIQKFKTSNALGHKK